MEGFMGVMAHLSPGQRRVVLLRDQLRYLDPAHLDTFLVGLEEPEPPAYKNTNEGVQPPLIRVAISASITRFDLGNVESETELVRVHLTFENGAFGWIESEALPVDGGNPDAVPIQKFLTRDIVRLHKVKFTAIYNRAVTFNTARFSAFDDARDRPLLESPIEEEVPATSRGQKDVPRIASSKKSSSSRKRARVSGNKVDQHRVHKKKRSSVRNVSHTVKTKAISSMPVGAKAQLFDTFVKTAFPSLDDLMIASWNVVSMHKRSGQDSELDTAIGGLHEVLQKFDKNFDNSAESKEHTCTVSKTKSSKKDGTSKKKTKEHSRTSPVQTVQTDPDNLASPVLSSPPEGFIKLPSSLSLEDHYEGSDMELQVTCEPKRQRKTKARPRRKNSPMVVVNRTPRNTRSGSKIVVTEKPCTTKQADKSSRLPRTLTDLLSSPSSSDLNQQSSAANVLQEFRNSALKARHDNRSSATQPIVEPTAQHGASRAHRTPTDNTRTQARHSTPSPSAREPTQGQYARRWREDSMDDALFVHGSQSEIDQAPVIDEDEDEEVGPVEEEHSGSAVFLGTSRLGQAKSTLPPVGIAPVAPMIHNMQQMLDPRLRDRADPRLENRQR